MPKPKTKLLVLIRLGAHRSTQTHRRTHKHSCRAEGTGKHENLLWIVFPLPALSGFLLCNVCVCVCIYFRPPDGHFHDNVTLWPQNVWAGETEEGRVGEREGEGGRQANSDGDGANNMWSSVWHKCSLCMCVCVCVRVIKNNNNNTHRQATCIFIFIFICRASWSHTANTPQRPQFSLDLITRIKYYTALVPLPLPLPRLLLLLVVPGPAQIVKKAATASSQPYRTNCIFIMIRPRP